MAIVEGGDSAHYWPGTDTIHMPGRVQVRQIEHWYATLFHEAGHWTGPAVRPGRDMTSRYGDDRYAARCAVRLGGLKVVRSGQAWPGCAAR